jgi:hypothetical protein
MSEIDPLLTTTAGFADQFLGLPLYTWQARGALPLEKFFKTGKRQNVVIVTPNGSGKDERIIPTLVYYWLFFAPKGRVVLTTKSDIQLSTQTLPNLDKHWRKFGWQEPVGSPRWMLTTPTGGNATCFVTNDGSRVEGHHSRPGEPLIWIVNEAKSITSDIWEGIDRCTPDVLVLISSPGLKEGRLFEATKLPEQYTIVRAGLADCPHIPKEKIDHIISTYGIDDPVTRSTLYGEFMEQADDESFCLTDTELEGCVSFPPEWIPGFKYGFFDFADGQAENSFCVRDGNKFSIADAWRDKNEDAVVGRAIVLMRKFGLSANQCGADAAAKSILDKLASAGYALHRQNFGAPDKFRIHKSWSAWAWLSACQKIRNREIIVPNDEVWKAQITNRKKLFTPTGLMAVEDKHDMDIRRVKSPDRADSFVGCASAVDARAFEQVSFRDRLRQGEHEAAMHGMSVGF